MTPPAQIPPETALSAVVGLKARRRDSVALKILLGPRKLIEHRYYRYYYCDGTNSQAPVALIKSHLFAPKPRCTPPFGVALSLFGYSQTTYRKFINNYRKEQIKKNI